MIARRALWLCSYTKQKLHRRPAGQREYFGQQIFGIASIRSRFVLLARSLACNGVLLVEFVCLCGRNIWRDGEREGTLLSHLPSFGLLTSTVLGGVGAASERVGALSMRSLAPWQLVRARVAANFVAARE